MIDKWDVYWVMQMDSITASAVAAAVLCGAAGGFVGFIGIEEDDSQLRKWGVVFLIPAMFCAIAATFLPSSKTAAAMILVPALTLDQVIEPVSAEALELYALAKKALTKLADEPAKEEPK